MQGMWATDSPEANQHSGLNRRAQRRWCWSWIRLWPDSIGSAIIASVDEYQW